MATTAVQNVVAFLTGQPPLTPVNPEVLLEIKRLGD
jgi:hypothetical protein